MSSAEQGPPDGPVTIIRYPNRRLYDRSRARYVTLRDVEDTVRGGRDVVVRDSKTGEDLTRSLLTQIILERHPERMELFPVALLHQVIRANVAVFGLLRDSVRQSLQYAELLRHAAPFNPLGPAQEWLRSLLPGPEPPAPPPPGPDTDALLRRIDDLERRLDEFRAAERPAAAPRRTGRGRGGRPRE